MHSVVSGEAIGDVSGDASGDAEPDAGDKADYQGPKAEVPQLLFRSAVSLWVKAAAAGTEYGIRKLGEQRDFEWQNSNLFFGLEKHTSYEIAIRYKETEVCKAGGIRILVANTDDWQYSIRYHLNQGKNPDANETAFQAGGNVLAFSAPIRSGYQFAGWYQDSGFHTPIQEWNCITEKNLHVYAKWNKVELGKITGVKVSLKGKNKAKISFTKKATAYGYELQYSTSSKFEKKETATKLVTGNSYTTPALARGMKYYIRIRSVSYDSCGDKLYGNYSTVKSITTKAVANGSSGNVAAGTAKKKVRNNTNQKENVSAKSTSQTKKSSKKNSKIKKPVVKTYQKGTIYLSVSDEKQLKLPPAVSENGKVKGAKKKGNSKWKKLRITISNKKIATVSAKGVVKAKKQGNTRVVLRRGYRKYIYNIVVEKVSLTKKKISMVVGDYQSIALSKAVSKVKWNSSKPSVASVDTKGGIRAVGAGTTTITASYHGHTYKANVTVITVEQNKINQTKNFYFESIYRQISIGETFAVPYQVTPSTLQASDIAWYTSDSSVAIVDNGIICGVGAGTAVISVKYQSQTAKMKVQVLTSAGAVDNVRLISHRGSSKAPENSLAAFEAAADSGYSYVETDIRWTKDNVPVLLHDKTVGRTSNALEDIEIGALTYAECLKLDFGNYFGEHFKDTRIVRFDAFLELCRQRNLNCYIELKGTIYREQCKLLSELVKHYGMESRVTFISFSENSLISIQELLPNARLGYLCSEVKKAYVNTVKELANGNNEVFMDISYTAPLSLEQLQMLGNAEIVVEGYTIDSLTLANQAVFQGIQGITTNVLLPSDYRNQRGE